MKRYDPDEYAPGMREAADGDYYHRDDLIAAGCLVPVPAGDKVPVRKCTTSHFLHDGNCYRMGTGGYPHLDICTGDRAPIDWSDTIVQPVRLVKLGGGE